VVVAGHAGNYLSVQRLNPDGSLDTTFNKTGSVTITTGKGDNTTSVALQPDGKILVGGVAEANNGTGEFLIARVNANGTLDSTFASKGIWVSSLTADQVNGLAVLTDPANPNNVTGIVAAAQGFVNGKPCFEAIELSAAGKLDSSFGSGGFAVFAYLSGGQARAVAVAPSGEIYLAGYVHFSGMTAAYDGCVAAVTPAWALDGTFGGGAGYVLADPPGSHESGFYDLVVQTLTVNGHTVSRLVTAGYYNDAAGNPAGFVSAYTLGGTLDTTFGSGGSYTFVSPPGEYSLFNSLALEADGSIVVGGEQYYLAADGNYHPGILVGHLTPAGAADTSFGSDGTGFTTVQDGQNSEAKGLAIDPRNGDILTCGYTTKTGSPTPWEADILRLTAP
jgi:uncharacterized delta-60 repeat protein